MTLSVCNVILVILAAKASCAQEVKLLRAVRGREARLPCGQDNITLDGPNSYVLWLKNDRIRYRYPNPEAEKLRGTENYISGTLCESGLCRDNTWLLIKKMTHHDEGLYRCRVHYQASPSEDYVYDLKVVEPIEYPRLYSDNKLIKQGTVGPLSLGSDVTIICEVEDKDPKTAVYWTRNGGSAIVTQACTRHGSIRRVDIHLRNITRDDLGSDYECVAQNADVSAPLVTSVSIRMYLAPMSVEIRMNNNYEFEVGQPRVVDCVVVGCIPPPAVSWYLGAKKLRATVHKELHDGNYTVSSLTLVPSIDDDGSELVCKVHNFYMINKVFQDKVTLNVGYRPTCQVSTEEKIGIVVRELETAKCIVEASPEPVQFSWTFADSKTLYTTFTKVDGYRNRYSATLNWLSRDADIGMLHCRAINSFGEQKKPCTYNITAGGPPELPNCKVDRIYPNSLRVQCIKGWDGGRPQMVHLDIVDETGTCIRNVSDNDGHFYLSNVVDHVNLSAVMYSTNARGKSEMQIISLYNLPAIPEASNNYVQRNWMPYIEGFTGVVALAIAATIITLIAKILRADRRERHEINLDIVPLPDGIYHREPDFVRDERLLGRTNVTINQLSACQNQHSPSSQPKCRLLLGSGPLPRHEHCPSSQHTYYV